MDLKNFLRIISWQNLLYIILVQYLIRYALFLPFHITVSLGDHEFFLLILASLLIAAGGDIIEKVANLGANSIHFSKKEVKGPALPENIALYWFFGCTIVGVALGFYLANSIGQPAFSGFFVLSSALLYLNSTYLKNIPFIGNLTSSMLVGLIFLVVPIFDLLPAITSRNIATQQVLFSIVMDYAMFAMMISFLRVIVKDQEAIKADYNSGKRTLSIVLGTQRTNWLLFIGTFFSLGSLIFYLYSYLLDNLVIALYALFFLVAPLLFFLIGIIQAKKPGDFKQLGQVLKGVLLAQALSLGIYQYILI